MRVLGKVILRPGILVGEIAPAPAGNEDLRPGFGVVVQNKYRPAPLPCFFGAEKPRSPRADDNDIELFHGRIINEEFIPFSIKA